MIKTKVVISEIECKGTNAETYFLPTREVLKQYNNYILECLEKSKEIDSFEKFIGAGRVKS
jgi:hypothetical protein